MYTTVFTLISQWLPLLYAILGFGSLIVIHECGHFLFCKLFNIHTPTFSIGMGPTLIQKKAWGTDFKISLLPLGGYVEIAGHEEVGQGEQEHAHANDETAFRTKPYWQKLLVMLGGIIFNLAFAYKIFIILHLVGLPRPHLEITTIAADSIASKSGLQPNDIVISLGESNLEKNPELITTALQELQEYSNKTVALLIKRKNETVSIPLFIPSEVEITKPTHQKGKLGIEFAIKPSNEKITYGVKEAISKGIAQTNLVIYQTIAGLKNLFASRSLKGAGGPIMIISQSVKQAQAGITYLFIFLAIISINLAIMNLLPLPILDGGQLFFISLESLIRRPIPSQIKNGIFIGSWVAILALIVLLSYRDILALIK